MAQVLSQPVRTKPVPPQDTCGGCPRGIIEIWDASGARWIHMNPNVDYDHRAYPRRDNARTAA